MIITIIYIIALAVAMRGGIIMAEIEISDIYRDLQKEMNETGAAINGISVLLIQTVRRLDLLERDLLEEMNLLEQEIANL